MQSFNPRAFIDNQINETRSLIGDERALIAISGGVDSTTCAVLTHRAVGDNLQCVILDDAFMRTQEPEHIAHLVSAPPLKLPIKIVDVKQRFLKALEGLEDAEDKRKAFRETFYKTLGETAKEEKSRILVQGTIKADIEETTKGVKTQHNVLEQMGINTQDRYGFKLVEPLRSLYKWQVRMVASELDLPAEITNRQPFPGPGLSVRVVGKITNDKLASEKLATAIAEAEFAKHEPSQYFAAIFDNTTVPHVKTPYVREMVARYFQVPSRHVSAEVFKAKATGLKRGKRIYGQIVAISCRGMNSSILNPPISRLVTLQSKITQVSPTFTRAFCHVKGRPEGNPYSVVLRAVETKDFLTARVFDAPWDTLNATAAKILETCNNVSDVYYDVTTKPPATVEME
jgi:GMP synthase (glutamine-hydrolysing)